MSHGIDGEVILQSLSPLAQCSEATAMWTGGEPPYVVQAYALFSDAPRIVARTSETRATWLCDYPAGINVAITVWDARNSSVYYAYKPDNIVGEGPSTCELTDATGTPKNTGIPSSTSIGPSASIGPASSQASSDPVTPSPATSSPITPSPATSDSIAPSPATSSSVTPSSATSGSVTPFPATSDTHPSSASGTAVPTTGTDAPKSIDPVSPSLAPSPSSSPTSSPSSSNPAGVIAGIAVGSVVGALLIIALLGLWWRRRRLRQQRQAAEDEPAFEIEDPILQDHVTPFRQPPPPVIREKTEFDSLSTTNSPPTVTSEATGSRMKDVEPVEDSPPAYGHWEGEGEGRR